MAKKQQEKGRTYCRPSKKDQSKLGKTARNYCSGCGLHIRSTVEAHEAGGSHKRIIERNKRALQTGKVSIYK